MAWEKDGKVDIDEILKEKREEILYIASRYGAANVRIFGSAARCEADAGSDIDLLVDMEPDRSLMDLGGLWYDLNDLLGVRVDVFTETVLKKRVRERAVKEAVPL
jgi:hypothetical protein